MKDSFNTPVSIKWITYVVIFLTPILVYLIIFIMPVQIPVKIKNITEINDKHVTVTQNTFGNFKLVKQDFFISYANLKIPIDSICPSRNYYQFYFNLKILEGSENYKSDQIVLYLQKKTTLYNLFKRKY